MPHPLHNHSHSNVLNTTESTLIREDSLSESIDSDVFAKKLNRRHSLLNSNPNEDSYKRLPQPSDSESASSYKRLPMGENLNDSFKRLPILSRDSNAESAKRLPSMTRRNSFLSNNIGEEGAGTIPADLKRQPSVTGKFLESEKEGGRSSVTSRRPGGAGGIKEWANASGGDLLNRQSSITHRNSISLSDDNSRPSLVRKSSIVSGLMKAMRWTEESEADKKRRLTKNWDDFYSLYKKGASIGKGTQGSVFYGTRYSDQLPVVLKFIEESSLRSWNTVQKMPVSAHLLRHLNYPEENRNDPLFSRYVDHFHIEKTWVLVTEYEEHDWIDLFDYIRQRKKPVSERQGIIIFSGIAQALCRLHSAGFTHNDVKENNVLIHRETLAIKLIDLCACREISNEPISPTEYSGTLAYATPEVRTGNYFSPESQDIYSTGILLILVLLGGRLPGGFNLEKETLDPHVLPKWIKELELDISSVTIKFIQSMISRKESKRPQGILQVVDFASSALEWA